MREETELLKGRFRELKMYFKDMKREIKKYPVGSREYDELYGQLSDLSMDLSFMRTHLRTEALRLNYLNNLLGRLIMGKESSHSDEKSKAL